MIDTARLESSFDGGHGEEDLVWVILKLHKFMVKIERAGGLVQSFNHNANRRYFRPLLDCEIGLKGQTRFRNGRSLDQ